MKRSEVMYQLAGLLSTFGKGDTHPEDHLYDANNVLDALEKLGMVPPKIDIQEFDFYQQCRITASKHVWEYEEGI